MKRLHSLTALATMAVVFGAGGVAAQTDPFADQVISFQPMTPGTDLNGDDIDTSADWNDPNGGDAVGAPQWPPAHGRVAGTSLGIDQNGTPDRDDDSGGSIVLSFIDNVCVDGDGHDIRIYDVGNEESAMVEVSNDGGLTYMPIGEVVPGVDVNDVAGYYLDLDGRVTHFDRVRITATDHFVPSFNFAGIDLDAVECLNSAEPGDVVINDNSEDGCDVARGSDGMDIRNVVASSDGLSINVTMTMCGEEISNRAEYRVMMDYTTKRRYRGGDEVADGPDTLNNNYRCRRTYDSRAKYRKGRTRGPGTFEVYGNTITYTVDYTELEAGSGVTSGSEVLIWVKSKERGISDRVPTTERGDWCGRPQFEKEVFSVTLQ